MFIVLANLQIEDVASSVYREADTVYEVVSANPILNLNFYKVAQNMNASPPESVTSHNAPQQMHSAHRSSVDNVQNGDDFCVTISKAYCNAFGQRLNIYLTNNDTSIYVPLSELKRHGVKVYNREYYENLTMEELER